MSVPNKHARMPFFWISFASLVGAVGTHFYLMTHHYQNKFGLQEVPSFCNISEKVSCAVASSSEYSELFGIPMALFGALINGLLLLLLCGYKWPIFKNSTQAQLPSSMKIASLGIFIVSLVMGGISFFVIDTICPFCVGTYVLSLLSMVGLWIYLGGSMSFHAFEIKTLGILGITTLALGFFAHRGNLAQYGGKKVQSFVHRTVPGLESAKSSQIHYDRTPNLQQ